MRCLALVLAVLSFVGCSPTSLPGIELPAQLLHDSDALSAEEDIGSIPANKWPDSIQKLKPTCLTKEKTGIYITTFAETGIGACGYVVAHHKPANSDHLLISDTHIQIFIDSILGKPGYH
jgi:hypothetical protein